MPHDIERLIHDLSHRHRELTERSHTLSAERADLSFAALGENDTAAQKRLTALNKEATTLDLEIENVGSALVEANKRLLAKQTEAERARQKEHARKLRAVVKAFVELGAEIDELLSELTAAGEMLKATVTEIHTLGSAFPSHSQLQSLGERAFHTALQGTMFQQQHMAPSERTSFSKLIGGWAQTLEQGINQVIGETKKKAAA
jgi:hypothetical protein